MTSVPARPRASRPRDDHRAAAPARSVRLRPPRTEPLDETDLRLIELLAVDGRANNRWLADQVGMTEATVASRIRSLVERRVLGITATFDWEAAGYSWSVYLPMNVEGQRLREITDEIIVLPQIHSAAIVFGSYDIIAHALFASREELATFLAKDLARVKGIRSVSPVVSLDVAKYAVNFASVPITSDELYFPDPVIDLDEFDYSILRALVRDGRQSNREIARQLGVSDGTIRSRLRRIEDSGLMRICAQVDPVRAGTVGAWAFVGVRTEPGRTPSVVDRLAAQPEVLALDVTVGTFDVIAFVAGDTRARMVDVIADEIRPMRGVRATETWDIVDIVRSDFRWVRNLP